ncbi:helix-turn-helix domain-containing protein [Arthrobacter sp. 35W]|uniref:helix-turn-helix domain-containing protein n=1 Tax=Arthrobacter sp. 35W TaxID=1132441 RepID=UPI000415178F|nr:helix-turn-helix transcriptional regulator [Arthrobacter sp. 35W]
MGNSFGDRLRNERLARSLTQAELGGDLYSASYVSLLENGRREPTMEVIKQLAKQLQLAPHAVQEWTMPVSPAETAYLLAALYARQSWDMRDYAAAARQAGVAADKALENKDPVSWWNMAYLQANSLLKDADFAGCRAVVAELLKHPLSEESVGLSVRARQLMASASLGLGQLSEAIDQATAAVERGTGIPEEFDAYIAALRTLIGALAETGRLDDAWSHCVTLSAMLDDSVPSQLAGEIYWVIGNVAFMRHDVDQGLANHAKAGRMLSPASDLALWAQFNKATAWVRLAAGVVEPATMEAIERAELAQSVVGANLSDRLEVSLLRARWLYLNGSMDDALALLQAINSQQDALAKHTAGDTALLLGKALKALGRTAEALVALNEAKEHFAEAGAADRVALTVDNILEIRAADRQK